MTDAEILNLWLCAKCYGKNVYRSFDHGWRSEYSSTLTNDSKITLRYGSNTLELTTRNQTKSTMYKQDFFNNHGYIIGAEDDHQFVNFFDSDCWGKRRNSYSGSYNNSISYKNTQIYYADLRDDILVYFSETGSCGGSASGSSPMGLHKIYADFGFGTGCKTIGIMDAILMPFNPTGTPGVMKETIMPINYTPYSESPSQSSTDFNIASSDYSGYCGGVSAGCYAYGNYAVIDESQFHDCKEGIYTDLVKPEPIFSFRNSWDTTGVMNGMDIYDLQKWEEYTSIWFTNLGYKADETTTYPSFVYIDVMPHGSFVTDASGNYFYSMITRDLKVFNRLNSENPDTISKLEGSGIVYYPVAPA